MKKQKKTLEESSQFKRFDDLLRQVISVPKDKILEREKEEKQNKKARKADKP